MASRYYNSFWLRILKKQSLGSITVSGPGLPFPISKGSIVTNPATGDLVLMGGKTNEDDRLKSIYSLSCVSSNTECNWKLEEGRTLLDYRSLFSAFIVPKYQLPSCLKHDEI